jgi:hypothetical protein
VDEGGWAAGSAAATAPMTSSMVAKRMRSILTPKPRDGATA